MDLQAAWKKLEAEYLQKPIDWKDIKKPEDFQSKHPALKLQHSLKISLGFAVVLTLVFAAFIPLFSPWQIKLLLLLVVAGYGLFLLVNYRTYRQVSRLLQRAGDASVKSCLQTVHTMVYRTVRFQEYASVLFYPVVIIAGFTAGLFIGDPKGFAAELESANNHILLAVLILILTPLTFYAARWLYKKSYSRYLSELKAIIEELEKE